MIYLDQIFINFVNVIKYVIIYDVNIILIINLLIKSIIIYLSKLMKNNIIKKRNLLIIFLEHNIFLKIKQLNFISIFF